MPDPIVDARRKARANLTDAERNGLSFWDSIVTSLYREDREQDDSRFRKKIRRSKPSVSQDGGPL